MRTRASYKNAPMSPKKVKLVADITRGRRVIDALNELNFSKKKAAVLIKKVLQSALANAEHNNDADIDSLFVASIQVNEGRVYKRTRPRAKGRLYQILKRNSHIYVEVEERGL